MNGKSFVFGKNYDSDYLCGKRLKRRQTLGQRNDKSFRNRRLGRKANDLKDNRIDKSFSKLTAIEKSRKYLNKSIDKRLTLNRKTVIDSDDSYHKNYGLFANGKASNVVNRDLVSKDRQQFKARIKEDLFWILKKKNESKVESKTELEFVSTDPKSKPLINKTIHKPIYASKQTQKNSLTSLGDISAKYVIDFDRNEDKLNYSSVGLSPIRNSLNGTRVLQNRDNCSRIKSLNKIKIRNKSNHLKSDDRIGRDLSANKSLPSMPSLPSSLSVVQNLMNSYENERNVLAKRMDEFKDNLINKISANLKQKSKSFNQSIDTNLVQNLNKTKAKNSSIYSTPKSLKSNINQIIDNKNEFSKKFSLLPYNQREANNVLSVAELKQLEPRIGNILSKILLNISEAFQTLSSKCREKSYFE